MQEPLSRGELPTAFLRGDLSPEDYASSIDLEVNLAAPCMLWAQALRRPSAGF